MINKDSQIALKNAQWTSAFKCPLYDHYAFSCIPGTVSKLLTGKGDRLLSVDTVGGDWGPYECVVVFIIDAFGWQFFESFAHKYPFLEHFVTKEGIASKISCEFPSTTAAHITSFHTDKEVGETGIYEWFYYEPLVDKMIAPLLFSNAGDHESGKLLEEGVTPAQLFPFETVYQKLARMGVHSIALQHESIAQSPYSQAMLAGAEIQSYVHFHSALDRLAEMCNKRHQEEKTYIFLYFGDIDAMGHRHGITSPQFVDAIDYCWTTIENRFWKKVVSCPNRTAVIFTADHGMVSIDPKKTIYLNRVMPELEMMVKKNRFGSPLVPAGSCRDFFLHLEEEHLNTVHKELTHQLHGLAEVVFVEKLLNAGFFGNQSVSQRLRERIGNLVVLPYQRESVFWWFKKHHFEQHFYGAHGGLTPEEMETIFLFTTLGT